MGNDVEEWVCWEGYGRVCAVVYACFWGVPVGAFVSVGSGLGFWRREDEIVAHACCHLPRERERDRL